MNDEKKVARRKQRKQRREAAR